jgi:hypothetical protein
MRSCILRCGMTAFLLVGTCQANAQMELKLDPAKSNGFTTWEDEFVSTTLSIYEKVGDKFNLIVHKTTTTDYIRIDPIYFNTPDYYYKIVGTNADNTTAETGYVPALPPGGTGYLEHGKKVCNGKSYAYELIAFENNVSANIRLKADYTNNYYDPNTLVWIPYFQAIDQTTWNAMSSSHPYKSNQYKQVNIANYIDDANFFDKMNNPVTCGWLVEKKFDQFIHFCTASTRSTPNFPINWSPPLTGVGSSWVGFFNTYLDTLTYNGIPDTLPYFAPTIPSGLECVLSYSLPDPIIDTGMNWNEWAVAYEESVRELEEAIGDGGGTLATAELEDLLHTIYIDDNEDVYTTGITFKKYKADAYINLIKNENQLDVYSVGSSIPAGLYEVNVFCNKGKVLPLYMDVKYAIPFSPLKDYAEVQISPNPILSNDLNLKIDNKKSGNITVKLYDINGNLLNTDSFFMNAKLVTKHYDISTYSLPSNQIIAKVIFADDSFSSVIGMK